jgi:UDP-N-acetyl-D-mannosaminuronate dehydrogenase
LASRKTAKKGAFVTPPALQDIRIAVIGLGYVGLPLAVALGRVYPTTGFDIRPERIAELKAGRDATREATARNWRARNCCSSAPMRRKLPRATSTS